MGIQNATAVRAAVEQAASPLAPVASALMSAAQMVQAVFQRALTWATARNASLLEFESTLERGSEEFLWPTKHSLMYSKSLKTYRPSLKSSRCRGRSETLGRSSWALLMFASMGRG